jgi:hypothetical protein
MKSLFVLLIALLISFIFFTGCQKVTPDTSITAKATITSIYVQLPLATDTLTGTIKAAQNSNITYQWVLLSGPNMPMFSTKNAPTTIVGGLIAGTYVFQFQATNSYGNTAVDTVKVIVLAPICTETGIWVGDYDLNGSIVNYVPDSTFIFNGIAQILNTPFIGNATNSTNIRLVIPSCRVFNADEVNFVVSLKNPSSGPNAVSDYDAGLYLLGSGDTARVIYNGANRPQFNHLGLMHTEITNAAELQHLFNVFTTVSLQTDNGVLSTYINGTFVKSFTYTGNQVGQLNAIDIGFKGSGSVDWVKLYDSRTNKLLMSEDFNSPTGKSNVIWY